MCGWDWVRRWNFGRNTMRSKGTTWSATSMYCPGSSTPTSSLVATPNRPRDVRALLVGVRIAGVIALAAAVLLAPGDGALAQPDATAIACSAIPGYPVEGHPPVRDGNGDRKSTRLNSSHSS